MATLEDWFDPRHLRDDYAPTSYKPYGVKTRAVKGHEFGLQLAPEDKKALIAFPKTRWSETTSRRKRKEETI